MNSKAWKDKNCKMIEFKEKLSTSTLISLNTQLACKNLVYPFSLSAKEIRATRNIENPNIS